MKVELATKAVRSGVIFAEPEEISINPKLAAYVIKVQDEKVDAIPLFHAAVDRKND